MPNTNAQAIRVSNRKIRPCSDAFGQLYNLCKALQADAQANGWTAQFPNDANQLMDGADVDGRNIILNSDVFAFINVVGSFITYMEQTSNANRNVVMKIAVNPERVVTEG
jgi:hypothetical protein